MNTPWQYVLVSDHPQKDHAFRQLRAEAAKRKGNSGSFYAFHGSAAGNWHCILRIGLKNYSNTDKMSAGAASGPGIYLANNAQTSFSYMKQGQAWEKSTFGEGISCIALCEIIDHRKDAKTTIKETGGNVYVVQDENLITTRYFFVYPDSIRNNFPRGARADQLKLPTDIYA